MTGKRGITFGGLPETAVPEPERAPQVRIRETRGPGGGHRVTVMDGGLTCSGYGEVARFSLHQDAVEVTTFGSTSAQYIHCEPTAAVELIGGPLPQLGARLTFVRDTRFSFTGIVRSIHFEARRRDSPAVYTLELSAVVEEP